MATNLAGLFQSLNTQGPQDLSHLQFQPRGREDDVSGFGKLTAGLLGGSLKSRAEQKSEITASLPPNPTAAQLLDAAQKMVDFDTAAAAKLMEMADKKTQATATAGSREALRGALVAAGLPPELAANPTEAMEQLKAVRAAKAAGLERTSREGVARDDRRSRERTVDAQIESAEGIASDKIDSSEDLNREDNRVRAMIATMEEKGRDRRDKPENIIPSTEQLAIVAPVVEAAIEDQRQLSWWQNATTSERNEISTQVVNAVRKGDNRRPSTIAAEFLDSAAAGVEAKEEVQQDDENTVQNVTDNKRSALVAANGAEAVQQTEQYYINRGDAGIQEFIALYGYNPQR